MEVAPVSASEHFIDQERIDFNRTLEYSFGAFEAFHPLNADASIQSLALPSHRSGPARFRYRAAGHLTMPRSRKLHQSHPRSGEPPCRV